MGETPSTGGIGREIPFVASTLLSKDASGDYQEISPNHGLHVAMGDGAGLDAFSRLRVSNPAAIFDSKQIYDAQPLYWDQLLTSSTSTHYPNLACTRLVVPANTVGASAIRQTKEYFGYQPGRSHIVQITGKMGIASAMTYRVGLFDASNGLFFEQSNGVKYVGIRGFMSGGVVDTKIAQSGWNIDKLDGTGESGLILDWTKVQIWVIDFQWLGVGRVRFGMVIGGLLYYCHENLVSNVGETVYMSTPNLPVRYDAFAIAGGPGVDASFDCICCAVFSEGGLDPRCNIVSAGMVAPRTAASGVRTPLIALRLKSTRIRAVVLPREIEILSGVNPIYWELILNPTLTAPSFASVNDDSACEIDVVGTGGAGGFVIASGYIPSQVRGVSSQIETSLKMVSNIAGDSDVILLAARGFTGNSVCYGSITWKENV